MEFKLYRCAHCGNIIYKLVDKGVPVVCCGEAMGVLTPNTTDGAVEKHVPAISREGSEVTITIGSVVHPMLEEHHIQFIAAVTDDTVTIKHLHPDQAPQMKLVTDKAITAYEQCNIHGFWSGK